MHGPRRILVKREVRRRRSQSAQITAHGLTNHECRLSNLSQSGAELVVEEETFCRAGSRSGWFPTLVELNFAKWSGGRARQSALSSFTNDLLALCGVMPAYLDEPTLRRTHVRSASCQEATTRWCVGSGFGVAGWRQPLSSLKYIGKMRRTAPTSRKGAANEPTRQRYKRMEAAWRASGRRTGLDGEPSPVGQGDG